VRSYISHRAPARKPLVHPLASLVTQVPAASERTGYCPGTNVAVVSARCPLATVKAALQGAGSARARPGAAAEVAANAAANTSTEDSVPTRRSITPRCTVTGP
jgi:hypothetical protein